MLVDQAEHTVGVGVIRSLGRAGHRVIATSPEADAIGFASRYADRTVVSPTPFDRQRFLPWLDDTIQTHRIDAIMATEGLLTAIAPHYDRYASLLPYAGAAALYRAMSKHDVMAWFRGTELERNLPPHVCVDSGAPPPDLGHLPRPVFFKGNYSHAIDGAWSTVVRAEAEADIDFAMGRFRADYRRFVVQGFVPGVGVGACYVRFDGRLIARLLHRRLHEVPPSGGPSSFRETMVHAAIAEDAEARLSHMRWSGPAMLEYRWDPDTNNFHLIEVNARFWGSLHLGLFAGVDFPRLLLEAMAGGDPSPVLDYPVGLQARETFPGELDYLLLRIRDRALPWHLRFVDAGEFIKLSLDPRVRSDMWFPGDRALALRRASSVVRHRMRRLRLGRRRPALR